MSIGSTKEGQVYSRCCDIMLKLIVKGRVQGVFFRDFTKMVADKYKISGTVKNLRNGDVEIFAQGDEKSLAKFEEEVREGPPHSRINSIEKKILRDQEFEGFEVV